MQKFTKEKFYRHLKDNQKAANLPWVISLDCDRTLVDRKKGSHFISKEIIDGFLRLKNYANFLILINTGRDWTSYQPIKKILNHESPCLFLSGRVFKWNEEMIVGREALLPHTLINHIWELFEDKKIPFLEIKHSWGHTTFISDLKFKNLKSCTRPLDWFKDCEPQIVFLDRDLFFSLEIVGIDLAITKKNYENLFNSIFEKNDGKIAEEVKKKFGEYTEEVDFTPVIPQSNYSNELGILRILKSPNVCNKGLGLRYIEKNFSIPQANFICCGDSDHHIGGDSVIKKIMPQSTLILASELVNSGLKADFFLDDVSHNGIVSLFDALLEL